MAQMVAMILNKGEGVSKTYAGANSFTDCVGHWASGAIALASSQGIISGVGNGKFKPNDPVTGAQASRMLVSALGYDTKTEGIGGAQWATKAVSVAKRAGLLDGLDGMNVNAVLTRDQASQMMFNALKADMVQYDRKADSIDLTGIGSINLSGSTATAVANDKAKHYDDSVTDDEKMQLCEEYFPDLKLDTDDDDNNYGRSGHTWTYKKDSVGPYVDEADIVYTSNKNTDDGKKDIKKDLEKADFKVAAAGTAAVDVEEYPDASHTITVAEADATDVANAIAGYTGNGKIVEVYLKADGTLKSVVAIAPKVGEVKVTEVRATNSRGAYTRYTVGGVSGQVFSTVVDEDKDVDTAVLSGDIQDGDLVTYYQGSEDTNPTAYIFATTEVSGLFTRANSGKTELTLGGTKYTKAATTNNLTSAKIKPDSKNEQTFVLDSYGYVVDITKENSVILYGCVLDDASYKELDGKKVNDVYAVLMATADGKVETIKVKDEAAVTAVLGADKLGTTDPEKRIVTYTIDEDDIYTLTVVGSTRAKAVTKIVKDSTALASGMIASGSSLFVLANYNDKAELQETVTTYTGFKNVPSYGSDGDPLTIAYAVDTDDSADGVANVVFVVDNVNANAKNEYVYLSGYSEVNGDGNIEYTAVVDGKQDVLTVKDDDTVLRDAAAGLYASITIADKVATIEGAALITTNTVVKYVGDVVMVGKVVGENITWVNNYKAGDDVPVYKIDAGDEENPLIDAVTVADLGVNKEESASKVFVNVDDGTAIAVYIIYNQA